MLKGKSVIGKEILTLDSGSKLDTVKDVVVDPEGRSVIALVVDEGGLMSGSRVVPIEEVASFGQDAVVVRSDASIVAVAERDELRAAVDSDEQVLGKKVFTTDGDDQGSIGDIYFDERTGAVVGYEVSGGLWGDASKGTSYLATDEITTMGADVIYVRPDTADALDSQVGGLQGRLEQAGSTLGEARDSLTETARGGSKAGAATRDDALIGKRTGSAVETDSGSVLIPEGRRVRHEDVEAARSAGRMQELMTSVAVGEAQHAGAGVKDGLGAAGDSASNLWDQFTAKIGEMTDSTGKRFDEEQTKRRLSDITDAVGRPVTKVVLDRGDDVILNLGDIITHQAIQRASDAGSLDSLLGSVYQGSVEFTKDEMRAPGVEAQATIDKSSGGATVVEDMEHKVDQAERARQDERERKGAEGDRERRQRKADREGRATDREVAKAERAVEAEPEPVTT